MVSHEGGRWDVGTEGDAVYLERISESDEQLFEDSLSPEEARALAGLLTKYADKAEESEDSGELKSKDSEESDTDSEKSDTNSEKSEKDSEKSEEESDKSEDDEDEDKSN